MPGVLSARWSGSHGDDEANLRLLLAQLADVPDERRGAQFVLRGGAGAAHGRASTSPRARVRGALIRAPRGSNGFGYDPIFVPDGGTLTTAEMSADEKDAISHRGGASARWLRSSQC